MNWQPPGDSSHTPKPSWSGWKIAGVVLATVIGILGLAALMFLIFIVIAINSMGGNK